MKRSTLWQRNLTFYWRTHLAVLLGVIAGTTVITGALIVGDSVRESLKQMSLDRLGGVDLALSTPRFIRQELADSLAEQRSELIIAPAMIMEGALVRETEQGTVDDRAGGIRVYGIDSQFAQLSELTDETLPQGDELVVSHRVAQQFGIEQGETLTLFVELPTAIPRDSLLGNRDEQATVELVLDVRHILPARSGTGRFDLNPGQQLPMTVFVDLVRLQTELGLHGHRDRISRTIKPARINTIFVGRKDASGGTDDDRKLAKKIADELDQFVGLEDLQLRVVPSEKWEYAALESPQMVLADRIAEAARRTVERLAWKKTESLVYVANEYAIPARDGDVSKYSVIAGVPFDDDTAGEPFGPLTVNGRKPKDDEIIINSYLADDLKAEIGDTVRVRYYEVGNHGELPPVDVSFKVAGIIPLSLDEPSGDRGIIPEVPGITDAETVGEWKVPFPTTKTTDRDDAYWGAYGGTPKGFVNLKAAQKLWRNRYGSLTSLRAIPREAQSAEETAEEFERELLVDISPADTGLQFQTVKLHGIQAASGTTDFTGLFIGFSFFVIVAAMILIGLLFRLGIERRTKSIGLLEAVGFTRRQIRNSMLIEGVTVASVGSALGLLTSLAYAHLVVYALTDPDWWGGAIGTQFLKVWVGPVSPVAGFSISVVVALIAILIALRSLNLLTPRQLLAGATEPAETPDDIQGRSRKHARRARIGFAITMVVTFLGMVGAIPSSEATFGLSWQVFAFFAVGSIALGASIFGLSSWLMSDRQSAVRGGGLAGSSRLGFRNAARHRPRSLLSAGLIACATFVIVAVAAGRRDPSVEKPDLNSGNGGYILVGTTAAPILPDLNSEDGRVEMNIDEGTPESAQVGELAITAFRMRSGENASCLNLYQTNFPTILGVPDSQIARGGFRFINGGPDDYWPLLNEEREDGHIPVLGDMNTLMYSLHKKVGDLVDIPDSKQKMIIVGMFDSSIFQGVLVTSDANFQAAFPDQPAGFRYFLVGASGERLKSKGEFTDEETDAIASLLESSLTSYGFDAERVADRIAAFLVVQNTYLSTFQTLGGLGLLLGTLGLATVMLRNVEERRGELALLRAVGFKPNGLSTMVLAENAMLLIWGLTTGTVSALLAMLPHLRSVGADTEWSTGALLLLAVFATGMLAALLAVREASHTPIVTTLRGE